MKQAFYPFILLLFMASCVSSEKYLTQGNYDLAIELAIKKLSKKPTAEKEILVLEKSYLLANQLNLDKIKYLRTEGSPDSWEAILRNYEQLRSRQSRVRPILPLQLPDRTINFERIDYDSKIVEAKQNATDFHYQKGIQNMGLNTKTGYRSAYENFKQTRQYFSSYKDVNQLMDVCKEKGMVSVTVYAENQSEYNLKPEFYTKILSFGTAELNTEWITFMVSENKLNSTAEYTSKIVVSSIAISPEKQDAETYTETKQIADGFEYVLDDKGNVKKDTTGKDIKKPKFKNISCKVTKVLQTKSASINCNVLYSDNSSSQVIKRTTIQGNYRFAWDSYSANGDLNALKQETKELLGKKIKAFPTNGQMIEYASDNLHSQIKNDIKANRNLFK